jgi:hypothetical protein
MAILALFVCCLVAEAYATQSLGWNSQGARATNATIFTLEVIILAALPYIMLTVKVWLPHLSVGSIRSQIFQSRD